MQNERSTNPKTVYNREWRRKNPERARAQDKARGRAARKKAEELHGTRAAPRLQFGTGYMEELAWRVFRCGESARSDRKDWFDKLPTETWFAQARRLAKDIPPVCPVFGTEWDLSGGKRSHASLSCEHHPDGSLGWVSWRANELMRDATSAELVACAEYRSKYEDGEV